MQCFVYASRQRMETYVWLRQRDAFDTLPARLRNTLGELRFVLEVDLDASRRLPHEDVATVMAHLRGKGWHLQLPPANDRVN